jgi:hypothetical protein
MIKIASLQAIAAALLACGLAAAPAQAGPNRTFVSGTGTDSGTCTRTAPCRTFAFAFTVTNAGGQIDVLDTAGYGAVTIIHAISIVNDGVGLAGITATSGNAITINAGTGDSVHLRGLTFEGLGSGFPNNGIQFNTGANLAIENCVVRRFAVGIAIFPSTTSSFSVSNTIASDNGGSGILVQPTGSAAVKGVLSKVITNNNSFGIFVDGSFTTGASLNVTIVDSEASNNSVDGVAAVAESGGGVGALAEPPAANVMLRDIVASKNNTGLLAGNNTIFWVAHSVVTGNSFGVVSDLAGILNRALTYLTQDSQQGRRM